ncbi:unnamed protein product [Effrenium voratum]|nr:unnamed protein product [Effrenium voratum]
MQVEERRNAHASSTLRSVRRTSAARPPVAGSPQRVAMEVSASAKGPPRSSRRQALGPCAPSCKSAGMRTFPTCVPTCKHSFDRFLPQLAYNKQACGTCTPKTYPGQQACACKVLCAQWYVRVGGGPEGPRSCSRTSDFDAPPACMRKPVQPSCPRPDALGLKVYGCNCKAGQADCPCHVQCMDGYRMTEGASEITESCDRQLGPN